MDTITINNTEERFRENLLQKILELTAEERRELAEMIFNKSK